MSHRTDLIAALSRLDEADTNKRITSGTDLRHWEAEYADALDEIGGVIDDLGVVECARLIVATGAA